MDTSDLIAVGHREGKEITGSKHGAHQYAYHTARGSLAAVRLIAFSLFGAVLIIQAAQTINWY